MAKIISFDIHALRMTTAKLMSRHLLDKDWAIQQSIKEEAKVLSPEKVPVFEDLHEDERRQLMIKFCLYDVDSVLKVWLYEYFIPHNRRWVPPMTNGQCEDIISREIDDQVYDDQNLVRRLAAHLICSFNEMLAEYIPGRSWHELGVVWKSETSDNLVLVLGEDYRVKWFMDNMLNDDGYVKESDFRLVLKDLSRSTHSDEVIIRMTKAEFEEIGVVNFKED